MMRKYIATAFQKRLESQRSVLSAVVQLLIQRACFLKQRFRCRDGRVNPVLGGTSEKQEAGKDGGHTCAYCQSSVKDKAAGFLMGACFWAEY